MQSDNVMMTLMALTNLAGLRYVQGHLRAAIRTCRQVVELASQRIGRQTPMLGKTLLNLGEMLREQGDLDAALATPARGCRDDGDPSRRSGSRWPVWPLPGSS